MGNVYAEITVKNIYDLRKMEEGAISEDNVRSATFTTLVDTGATYLVINDEICEQLGLYITNTRTVNLAGNQKMECKITEPVRIQWKDRWADMNAIVLPGKEMLLGVIPLEAMDLMVDPVHGELVGVNGDKMITYVY